MGHITALAFVTPLHRHPQPDLVLRLFEGRRAAWQTEACSSRARRVLVSGSPDHQLAYGVLAALWRLGMLRQRPALAALAEGNPRRVEALALDDRTAREVYTTAAALIRVHVTLLDRSCLTPGDVEIARACGLDVTLADARVQDGAA